MRFEEKRYRLVLLGDAQPVIKEALGRYWVPEQEDRGLRLVTALPQLNAFDRSLLENWQRRPHWRIGLPTVMTALAEQGLIAAGEYLVDLD